MGTEIASLGVIRTRRFRLVGALLELTIVSDDGLSRGMI